MRENVVLDVGLGVQKRGKNTMRAPRRWGSCVWEKKRCVLGKTGGVVPTGQPPRAAGCLLKGGVGGGGGDERG